MEGYHHYDITLVYKIDIGVCEKDEETAIRKAREAVENDNGLPSYVRFDEAEIECIDNKFKTISK